jgi:hypothetical protein
MSTRKFGLLLRFESGTSRILRSVSDVHWCRLFYSEAFLCGIFETSNVSNRLMKTKPFIMNYIQSELSSHNTSGRELASVVNQQIFPLPSCLQV